MSTINKITEESNRFEPRYSIALLYQNSNNIAMRVFISNASNEKEALNEATNLYRWTMSKYTLVQSVVANVNKLQA